MKIKKRIIVTGCALALFSSLCISFVQGKTRNEIGNSEPPFLSGISKTSQLRVRNGNSGESRLLLADDTEGAELLKMLRQIEYTKIEEYDQTGWNYMITFLDEDGNAIKTMVFISELRCSIDWEKYDVDEQDGKRLFELLSGIV